ncbi:MAG TPA: twin-arginine translocation pathway signal protein [Verrucomicrobiales bacterium]|nr:twin-arginine translocation pathway signal protein [Verrucomicrobiales bacterium]HRJ07514.1 sulfatase-like hydrolase/transferase [Prosthecobacter sp.]
MSRHTLIAMPSRSLHALLIALGLALQSHAAPPNVIMLLVDDMGYADLGCMGAKDIRTPHIDRIAAEGVRMTDFYANAPVCSPTRAAFITGRWQQRCGIEWAIGLTSEEEKRVNGALVPVKERFTMGLMPEDTFLVPLLKKNGYGTACYGKWHLGFKPEHNPVKHGFDEFWGILGGQCDYYRYHYIDGMKQLYEKTEPATAEGYITDLINQRTVRYIREQSRQPFFIYVPYNAVHHPYQVPDDPTQFYTAENKNDGTRAGYAKMLERVDQGIGYIFAALEEKGILDNTLIIFTSDNGGERFSDNRLLFNHKTTLWEGGIRVPCLLRWPAGGLPKGAVSTQTAITMDLTATLLAAVGLPVPPTMDGINLLPILSGKAAPIERTLCWRVDRTGRNMKAIRHGEWKYVQDDLVEMLFNLREDISERHDLYHEHLDKVKDLKAKLAAWEAEVDKVPPPIRIH